MNRFKIIFILIAGLWLILFCSLQAKDKNLAVNFLDVGQADAILLRTPQGTNILIDGGADNNLLYQVSEHLPWWDRTIDYVIISHFHDDHYSGLIELTRKYNIKNIIIPKVSGDSPLYNAWQQAVSTEHLKVEEAVIGQKYDLGQGINWQILMAQDGEPKDLNQSSVVVKVSAGTVDFLLMGDLPSSEEAELLQSGFDLSAEILKVGHHGSKYSSSDEFLATVNPDLCVIESGKDNKFGHPHQETIDRLEKVGCDIKNTQYNGTISVFSDGYKWWVK